MLIICHSICEDADWDMPSSINALCSYAWCTGVGVKCIQLGKCSKHWFFNSLAGFFIFFFTLLLFFSQYSPANNFQKKVKWAHYIHSLSIWEIKSVQQLLTFACTYTFYGMPYACNIFALHFTFINMIDWCCMAARDV